MTEETRVATPMLIWPQQKEHEKKPLIRQQTHQLTQNNQRLTLTKVNQQKPHKAATKPINQQQKRLQTCQTNSINSLKCYYTNATSLNTEKLAELETICEVNNPHVIFISDTWFKETSSTSLTNYTLYRKDRVTHAGGFCIYVRDDLSSSQVYISESNKADHVWCIIEHNGNRLLLGCVYRPPPSNNYDSNSLTDSEIKKALQEAKKIIDRKNCSGIIVAGDFNHPQAKWYDDGSVSVVANDDSPCRAFIDLINDLTLNQCVTFPTFIMANGSCKNTLDLILCESYNRIHNVESGPPLGNTNQAHSDYI